MKLQGQEIHRRGCNKKYPHLDDLDALYEQLKLKSIAELSKELDVPQNSIRFRVVQYFPDEWIQNIVKGRRWRTGLRGMTKPG